ncbi:unnamed protein product [Lampetra planeri]
MSSSAERGFQTAPQGAMTHVWAAPPPPHDDGAFGGAPPVQPVLHRDVVVPATSRAPREGRALARTGARDSERPSSACGTPRVVRGDRRGRAGTAPAGEPPNRDGAPAWDAGTRVVCSVQPPGRVGDGGGGDMTRSGDPKPARVVRSHSMCVGEDGFAPDERDDTVGAGVRSAKPRERQCAGAISSYASCGLGHPGRLHHNSVAHGSGGEHRPAAPTYMLSAGHQDPDGGGGANARYDLAAWQTQRPPVLLALEPTPGETPAIRGLLQYSDSFSSSASSSLSSSPSPFVPSNGATAASGQRSPFGGLGRVPRGPDGTAGPDTSSACGDACHPPSDAAAPSVGAGEVRHPPVGIAVAVARQRGDHPHHHNNNHQQHHDDNRHSYDNNSHNQQHHTVLKSRAGTPSCTASSGGAAVSAGGGGDGGSGGGGGFQTSERRVRHPTPTGVPKGCVHAGPVPEAQEEEERAARDHATERAREREQLLRENKELAEFARSLRPTSFADLDSNLVVTTGGGAAPIMHAGQWGELGAPHAHVAPHHWLPRTESPSLWLGAPPYGLGGLSLHQSMAGAFPPGLAAPPATPNYQLARDPATGHLVVVPADFPSHYAAELLERTPPPLWPPLLAGGAPAPHHHHPLSLTYQAMLRQHELYVAHQQAAAAAASAHAHALQLQHTPHMQDHGRPPPEPPPLLLSDENDRATPAVLPKLSAVSPPPPTPPGPSPSHAGSLALPPPPPPFRCKSPRRPGPPPALDHAKPPSFPDDAGPPPRLRREDDGQEAPAPLGRPGSLSPPALSPRQLQPGNAEAGERVARGRRSPARTWNIRRPRSVPPFLDKRLSGMAQQHQQQHIAKLHDVQQLDAVHQQLHESQHHQHHHHHQHHRQYSERQQLEKHDQWQQLEERQQRQHQEQQQLEEQKRLEGQQHQEHEQERQLKEQDLHRRLQVHREELQEQLRQRRLEAQQRRLERQLHEQLQERQRHRRLQEHQYQLHEQQRLQMEKLLLHEQQKQHIRQLQQMHRQPQDEVAAFDSGRGFLLPHGLLPPSSASSGLPWPPPLCRHADGVSAFSPPPTWASRTLQPVATETVAPESCRMKRRPQSAELSSTVPESFGAENGNNDVKTTVWEGDVTAGRHETMEPDSTDAPDPAGRNTDLLVSSTSSVAVAGILEPTQRRRRRHRHRHHHDLQDPHRRYEEEQQQVRLLDDGTPGRAWATQPDPGLPDSTAATPAVEDRHGPLLPPPPPTTAARQNQGNDADACASPPEARPACTSPPPEARPACTLPEDRPDCSSPEARPACTLPPLEARPACSPPPETRPACTSPPPEARPSCSPETRPACTPPPEAGPACSSPPEARPACTLPSEARPACSSPPEARPACTLPPPPETRPACTLPSEARPACSGLWVLAEATTVAEPLPVPVAAPNRNGADGQLPPETKARSTPCVAEQWTREGGLALLGEIAGVELGALAEGGFMGRSGGLGDLLTLCRVAALLACADGIATGDGGPGPRRPQHLLDPTKRCSWRRRRGAPACGRRRALLEVEGPLEVQIRRRLATLQRRYRHRQRQLACLDYEDEEERGEDGLGPVKRGRGRPRKRKRSSPSPPLPIGQPLIGPRPAHVHPLSPRVTVTLTARRRRLAAPSPRHRHSRRRRRRSASRSPASALRSASRRVLPRATSALAPSSRGPACDTAGLRARRWRAWATRMALGQQRHALLLCTGPTAAASPAVSLSRAPSLSLSHAPSRSLSRALWHMQTERRSLCGAGLSDSDPDMDERRTAPAWPPHPGAAGGGAAFKTPTPRQRPPQRPSQRRPQGMTPAVPPGSSGAPRALGPRGPAREHSLSSGPQCSDSEGPARPRPVSRLLSSFQADVDFSQNSSFSEGEGGRVPEPSPTPAPRSCVLDKDELSEGLRVLIPKPDKLLYAGHVQILHPPDVYGVVIEGERGNRPRIYSLEQLLQEAIVDVKPPSSRCLPPDTRVCAYWSQQHRCLYPGTVTRGEQREEEERAFVTVEFDDGDTGKIPISHIRLLPPDYTIQCAEASPALLVPTAVVRRPRKPSGDTREGGGPAICQPANQHGPQRRGKGRASVEPSSPPATAPTPTPAPILVPTVGPPGEPPPSKVKGRAHGARAAVPRPRADPDRRRGPPLRPAGPPSRAPLSPTSLFGASLSVDTFESLTAGAFSVYLGGGGGIRGGRGGSGRAEGGGASSAVGRPGACRRARRGTDEEPLVKLDHEGVTSPKSKKTKAMMMMMTTTAPMVTVPTATAGRDNVVATSVPAAAAATTATTARAPRPGDAGSGAGGAGGSGAGGGAGGSGAGGGSGVCPKSGRKAEDWKEISRTEESELSSSSESDSGASQAGATSARKHKPGAKRCSHSSSSSSSSSSTSSSTSSSSSSTSSAGDSSRSTATSSSSEEDSSYSSGEEVEEAEEVEEMEEVKEGGNVQPSPPTLPQVAQAAEVQASAPVRAQTLAKVSAGVHLPTTKELVKRQRLPSVENRPKISAFLPARQLWKWSGKPTQRRGLKGKARKLFYKAVVRGKETIRVGDSAVFLSAGRPNLPYIGRIQSLWESWGSHMVVRVKWFYHPEETKLGTRHRDGKQALYQSSHLDENDVQTISHRCLVVAHEQYAQMVLTKRYQNSEDLYYLAGSYDPTTGMVLNPDGVPVIC